MSPERTCVACRKRAPQESLIRVAREGSVLKIGRDLPGRGAWLHPTMECFRVAERRSAFGRALRFTGQLDSAALGSHLEGREPAASAL